MPLDISMEEENMGQVVQMFGRVPAQALPDTSMSAMRERMRRADLEDALRRLLENSTRPHPRLSLRLTRDAQGLLAVVASIDDGVPRPMGHAYPEDRLDDFAGVVRAALPGWIQTLSVRLSIRLAC